MKPGTRHDFLSERWGTQNLRKTVGMGDSLQAKLRLAVEGIRKHGKELADLSSSQHPDVIRQWTEMIDRYHENPEAYPDPYRVHSKGELRIYFLERHCTNLLQNTPCPIS